jgi:L-ascorbate metabolism protein UlaG (beta-lactamase superfamily)
VAHLGDLRRVPSQTEIEALGNVDVALVPVGVGGGLNSAKAAEVISLLEPGIVIPMHYHIPGSAFKLAPLSKFLKEMGLGEISPQPSLKVSAQHPGRNVLSCYHTSVREPSWRSPWLSKC